MVDGRFHPTEQASKERKTTYRIFGHQDSSPKVAIDTSVRGQSAFNSKWSFTLVNAMKIFVVKGVSMWEDRHPFFPIFRAEQGMRATKSEDMTGFLMGLHPEIMTSHFLKLTFCDKKKTWTNISSNFKTFWGKFGEWKKLTFPPNLSAISRDVWKLFSGMRFCPESTSFCRASYHDPNLFFFGFAAVGIRWVFLGANVGSTWDAAVEIRDQGVFFCEVKGTKKT